MAHVHGSANHRGSEGALSLRARGNLSADVAEAIREMIFDGRLSGGDRVPQDAIGEELGISRLPIREALISLQSEGLVVSEPRRGVYVVPLTAEDIEDHYEMYGHMIGLAARRAAPRITDDHIRELEELIDQMRSNPDAPSTHEAHWAFHGLVNRLGASRRLKWVLRQMAHNLPRSVVDIASAGSPAAQRGHDAIVAALRAGDADAAARACEQHLRDDSVVVVAELRHRGLFG